MDLDVIYNQNSDDELSDVEDVASILTSRLLNSAAHQQVPEIRGIIIFNNL